MAPRTEIERLLCDIWQAVLGLAQVGIKDNFLRLVAIRFKRFKWCSKTRRQGVQLSTRDLFECQEIGALAVQVSRVAHAQAIAPALGEQILLPIMHSFF